MKTFENINVPAYCGSLSPTAEGKIRIRTYVDISPLNLILPMSTKKAGYFHEGLKWNRTEIKTTLTF